HLPLTPATQHLINRQTLARMKPTAFLLNTARGGLVCEADLIEALRSKRIAGAGLDVFEQEPLGQSAFQELDNVVLTPPAAGRDRQARGDRAFWGGGAMVALRRGEWRGEKVVNPDVRPRFRW